MPDEAWAAGGTRGDLLPPSGSCLFPAHPSALSSDSSSLGRASPDPQGQGRWLCPVTLLHSIDLSFCDGKFFFFLRLKVQKRSEDEIALKEIFFSF